MDSEVEKIIAFIFKRSGKEALGFSELYLTLSMDLNWFTPEDAKQFINYALKQKILIEKKDLIKPVFDINAVIIPLGFHPSQKFQKKNEQENKKEEKNAIQLLIKKITEKQGQKESEIINQIKKLESEKNILFEVAALLLAKDIEIDVDEYIKEFEEKIN
jgi:hypothetical protein